MLKTGVSRREFLVGASVAALSVTGRRVFAQAATGLGPVLKAPCGVLRGEVAGGVRVFRGVPFAEPPIGALRFKAPLKAKSWTGERDATKFAAAAMQEPGRNITAMSEDCLYLNVWTPEGAKGLPVFVWVHGGGFTGGESFSPMFDGSEFARAGVIVVTVAYRLGVFGFLDMEPLLGAEYAGSGNNALRDLMCALDWVQKNAVALGADPARVTVGGESAGAKLTDILMGVPEAKGLFSQMISESGGAERVLQADNAKAVSKGFGETWGKGAETLKTAAAADLIDAQDAFIARWPQHFPLRPEIDGRLLPKPAVETIGGGSTHGKRLLIGTNRDESALFIGAHPQHDPTAADLGNVPLARFDDVFAKYKAVYPEMNDEMLRIRAVTAEEYWIPTLRVADAHLKGGGKAWMYRLDFVPTSGRYKGTAHHAEELAMVWDKPDATLDNVAAETTLGKQMHQAWVAFCKGETPAAPGLPAWPEYHSATRETMVLNTESRVDQMPQETEMRLWDGVLRG